MNEQKYIKPIPVVDLNKCHGDGICTHVCDKDVFKMQRLTSAQFATLSFKAKLNALLSNNLRAAIINTQECDGCGLCVTACMQGAISISGV